MSKICILFLVSVALTSAQYQPKASLYANIGGTGAFISLPTNTYANDLNQYGFNNRAYSTCITGTWLFYDYLDFNTGTDAPMEYIFSPSFQCFDFNNLGGFVSSAKYVGDATNYRYDTITFYQTTYFQGAEEYVIGDIASLNLRGAISSVIITGHQSWTVYDQINYAGQGICLEPYQTPDYEPAFVTDTLDVSPVIPHGSIKSVRKGCFSSKKITIRSSGKRISHKQ